MKNFFLRTSLTFFFISTYFLCFLVFGDEKKNLFKKNFLKQDKNVYLNNNIKIFPNFIYKTNLNKFKKYFLIIFKNVSNKKKYF
jgi:hypothetical protein